MMNKVYELTATALRTVKMKQLGDYVDLAKQTGGFRNVFHKYWRMDECKVGRCVGMDENGNKYYENSMYFFGRNRWVEYADYYGLNYDASQIAPEWYGWIHYKTDLLPYEDPHRPKYSWMLKAEENLSGTKGAYAPYSTTLPKIHAWKPKRRQSV